MDLSIIIVNYNVKELLINCLDSIYNSGIKKSYEIIVVDNNSIDGSIEILEQEHSDIVLIKNKDNKGFAAANNQGMRKAKGEYLLLLNPDTLVYPNTINFMLDFMINRPKVGILGCKLINDDDTLQSSVRNFPNPFIIFIESVGLFYFSKFIKSWHFKYLVFWEHDVTRPVDSVKGACFLTRKSVIDKAGLLDEEFFMYGEEVDFCKRVIDAGWTNYFTPDVVVKHLGGKSTDIHKLKNLIELHRSRNLYCRKHFNIVNALICKFLYGAGVFFRMVGNYVFFLVSRNTKYYYKASLFWNTLKWYFEGDRILPKIVNGGAANEK